MCVLKCFKKYWKYPATFIIIYFYLSFNICFHTLFVHLTLFFYCDKCMSIKNVLHFNIYSSVSSDVSKCYKTRTQLMNFKSRVYFPFHEAVSISLLMEQRLNDNYGINCMNNKILQNSKCLFQEIGNK